MLSFELEQLCFILISCYLAISNGFFAFAPLYVSCCLILIHMNLHRSSKLALIPQESFSCLCVKISCFFVCMLNILLVVWLRSCQAL